MSACAHVTTERYGAIVVFVIDHAPVNAMSHPVRSALLAALETAEADTSIKAIVVQGAGKQFVAGADVREFDRTLQEPFLHDVLFRIESCAKPVVAALHGAVLGGGAELALACHFRLAARDLHFGFPEIRLGIIPGSGGCVRFPRLVGTRVALDVMLSGEAFGFDRAVSLGVIDGSLDGDIKANALAFANELLRRGTPPRRLRELPSPPAEDLAICDEVQQNLPRAARRLPAGLALVEVVRAAIELPFADAMRVARSRFEACRQSSESRALRHLFFSERRRPTYAAEPRQIDRVGLIGAGTMGSGIAISLCQAGIAVSWFDSQPPALQAGIARVRSTLESATKKGRLSPEAAWFAIERIRAEETFDALAECDLVIEAVFESSTLKQSVFQRLGSCVRAGTVLATNTSTLDVDVIARASGRPSDVVGLHFFSPANVMRLVEIVRGRHSSEQALATAAALTRRLGKVGVEVGNAFGFVGNRMYYAYGREKELLMLEGATPVQVDSALEKFGMALGPNAVGDLAGLDVGYNARREWHERPADPRFFRVSDLLVERGWFGQKSGRGFYRYAEGGMRTPDAEVADLIRAEARRLGVAQREVSSDEVVERCVLALINEGARIVSDGVARSASDVDVVWCNGYGFPRDRGGPMFLADAMGLATVIEKLRRNAERSAGAWREPAPWLIGLANAGRSIHTTPHSEPSAPR